MTNDHLWLTLDTIRDRHAHQPEVAWLLGEVARLQAVNAYQADQWADCHGRLRGALQQLADERAAYRAEVGELRRRLGDVGPQLRTARTGAAPR